MKHRARHHHWIDGLLETVDHEFDSLESAIEHANSSDAHVIKIYNDDGEVVHTMVSSLVPNQISTYA